MPHFHQSCCVLTGQGENARFSPSHKPRPTLEVVDVEQQYQETIEQQRLISFCAKKREHLVAPRTPATPRSDLSALSHNNNHIYNARPRPLLPRPGPALPLLHPPTAPFHPHPPFALARLLTPTHTRAHFRATLNQSPRRVVEKFLRAVSRRAVVARGQPRVRAGAGELAPVAGDLPRRRSLDPDRDLRHVLHLAKER